MGALVLACAHRSVVRDLRRQQLEGSLPLGIHRLPIELEVVEARLVGIHEERPEVKRAHQAGKQ
ncbi:hypothetical protein D3C83_156220 [compost metagenome]